MQTKCFLGRKVFAAQSLFHRLRRFVARKQNGRRNGWIILIKHHIAICYITITSSLSPHSRHNIYNAINYEVRLKLKFMLCWYGSKQKKITSTQDRGEGWLRVREAGINMQHDIFSYLHNRWSKRFSPHRPGAVLIGKSRVQNPCRIIKAIPLNRV